ncbi:NAD(P)H-dependent oxidoreductase [Cohnella faecalis]|uniref:Flavodoxin family protein n=1 Tax=Cohnella faecalis TaxID=2315694 RepID=A0A398CGE3_9BACL|nr:NAD(P)H-dependent oxidoreductase [Cohnella faecalis]RIE01803.1 flavodoxin family protein [Cohnella faecalis]
MNMNIAIVMGHPDSGSYCAALAAAYGKGAIDRGASVRTIDLSRMEFNPSLKHGYRQRTELESDLAAAQETIRWADHLVFVYPTWWGTMPALLKGFLDRTLLPGFAFKYRDNSVLWDKLLAGKSARLIVTMDTPSWYNRFVYGKPGHRAMKIATLQFCGVKPVKITEIGPVRPSTEQARLKWLGKVEKLGTRFA